MSIYRYVFVNDQGAVFGSSDDPTEEDFAYAEVGMVTILRLADDCYFGREGTWRAIPCGQLEKADIDDGTATPFHAPAASLAEAMQGRFADKR